MNTPLNAPAFYLLAFLLCKDKQHKKEEWFNDFMAKQFTMGEKGRMICWLATVGRVQMARMITT